MDEIWKFQVKYEPAIDFTCTVPACDFKANNPQNLFRHLRNKHNKERLKVKCLHSVQCWYTDDFLSFANLKYHLNKYHSSFLTEEAQFVSNSDEDVDNLNSAISDQHISHMDDSPSNDIYEAGDNDLIQQHSCLVAVDQVRRENDIDAGKFVMNLLGERKMAQTDLQAVMKGVNALVKNEVAKMLSHLIEQLTENGCSKENIEMLSSYQDHYMKEDLFKSLKTQYAQQKYFVENYGLLMPKRETLPVLENVAYKRNRKGQILKDHYYLVPMLPQIERLLNFEDVRREINKCKSTAEGIYSCFESGLNFQNNLLFQNYPTALQIHVYLDEVQICNPLGSYNHKLVFVYFSIANLPRHLRSKFEMIHLLAIFYDHHVERYGYNILFRPIVEELKQLEAGVHLRINGKDEVIRGTLSAIVADNLASHSVAGFKLAFGKGFRKCRFCLATEEDIQSMFSHCNFTRRSKADHEEYCNALINSIIAEHLSKVSGIKFRSIFNELTYFHVVYGCPPDIMHDLLEGVVPLVLSQVISHCLKFISLSDLNHLIVHFNYGPSEIRDKPSEISKCQLKKKSIKGSASQKWLLATYLPLMIGSKIPKGDKIWMCYLILLKICRIVFSETATFFETIMLGSHIHDFLKKYVKHFKGVVTFKMHNLIHYPELIREFGPLGPFWTMRHEAKHSQMKSIQRHTRNFINVPYTLAYRHQQWVANRFLVCKDHLFKPDIETSKVNSANLSLLTYGGQVASSMGLHSFPETIFEISWIKINSTVFKVGESVLLCPLQGNRKASFGLLVNILFLDGIYRFVCKIYQTKYFDDHYQAFCINERKDNFHLTFSPFDFVDYHVYALHVPGFVKPFELGRDKFVVPKHSILGCSL